MSVPFLPLPRHSARRTSQISLRLRVVSLRVLRRGGGKNRLEADEVVVSASEPIARTVLAAGEEANEERQRLKRQILNIAS